MCSKSNIVVGALPSLYIFHMDTDININIDIKSRPKALSDCEMRTDNPSNPVP